MEWLEAELSAAEGNDCARNSTLNCGRNKTAKAEAVLACLSHSIGEADEDSYESETAMDKSLARFKKRIERWPTQCLRCVFGGGAFSNKANDYLTLLSNC